MLFVNRIDLAPFLIPTFFTSNRLKIRGKGRRTLLDLSWKGGPKVKPLGLQKRGRSVTRTSTGTMDRFLGRRVSVILFSSWILRMP